MATIRAIFPKSGNFFRSGYTPVVTTACRILLFTKLPIIKLKNVFSRFSLSYSALKVLSYVFRGALFIQSRKIKKKCKTAFSAKFRAMKLKARACSVFLVFISINQQLFHLALCTQICVESVKYLTGRNLGNSKRRSIHLVFR